MLKSKRIVTAIIIYSFIFSFFYNYFVFIQFKPFSIKLKEVKNRSFALSREDTYLLKIWGLESARKVRFNQEVVQPFYFRERGELKESYFKLPLEIVNEGINRLIIDGPTTYSVRVQNYIGKLESENFFILFNSAARFKNDRLSASRLILGAIFITFLLYGAWFFFYLFNKHFLGSLFKKNYSFYFLSYLPYFLIFFIIYLISIVTPYRIIISPVFFIGISILLIGTVQVPVIIYQLTKEAKGQFEKIQTPLCNKPVPIVLSAILECTLIFKQWFKKYKLSDILIVTSIVLIIICAFLWILTMTIIVDLLSNMAYLALLLGTIIKFVKLVRAGEGE